MEREKRKLRMTMNEGRAENSKLAAEAEELRMELKALKEENGELKQLKDRF